MPLARIAATTLFCAAAVAGFQACAADAASWPGRHPIHMIVAYPAGGVSDTVTRALAEKLTGDLGVPVVVENRGGAAGTIGMDVVAKAAPDGYTFGFSSISPLALNPHLMKPPFDPEKDILPVVSVMYSPVVLLATQAADMKDVKDFPALIDFARRKPGMVSWATSGKGSVGHIMAEQVMRKANVKILDVPYKGAGQQMQDALGSQFDVLSVNSAPMLAPQIKAGKLRPLAVAAPQRLAEYPTIPTFAELGYPGANLSSLFGIFAPAGLPAPILQRMNAAVNKALKDPKIAGILQHSDNVATGGTPESFRQEIERQSASNARIIKEAHITLQ
ncbi:tripartite tricarboxylate transporter substrate binding protein [Candidimonas humi]|uniref:Bug family tripartite tricarboxylate transporter substrate binding protein n=1 Tax=Candidimonas humi TaxID=683355 RepID=A0ABV8NVH1_9BURK|nr:tripartite tricarboxylate transporter substrate binding protein [Candidimonas humi]MBV6303353.1 tripartite tricarboxylate transporter substrate binding protein [Candidimonas humi]